MDKGKVRHCGLYHCSAPNLIGLYSYIFREMHLFAFLLKVSSESLVYLSIC